MKWDAIGAIGEIVGALAVVVTLLYLAVQIRVSTESERAEAERQKINWASETPRHLFEDAESTGIILKGLKDGPGSLTDAEAKLFSARLSELVERYWGLALMYEKGLIDKKIIIAAKQSIGLSLSSEGGSEWWDHTSWAWDQYSGLKEEIEN